MITDKQRAKRLHNHEHLKQLYENKLERAETDPERKHLKARIAEIGRNIQATMLDPLETVSVPAPRALLPETIKTVNAKKSNVSKKQKKHVKGVGSSF